MNYVSTDFGPLSAIVVGGPDGIRKLEENLTTEPLLLELGAKNESSPRLRIGIGEGT